MVLEITHRVVQYSVVQKITEQVGEPLLENIYKPKLNLLMDAKSKTKRAKVFTSYKRKVRT
jgi:ribulose 1,5-bisphosphate carboxylase large subunit-like protein